MYFSNFEQLLKFNFRLVGLFTCVELYTYCFNLMKYWIIAIVTAIYVFGTIMSIFGFVVCLLIFTENKLDDDGIIPRQKGTRIFWEGEQRQSMSKKECEFLLLFLVCLGSLALILTCRIILAFCGLKAHRNETMRTFRAIRNVEVTFDLSQFPPNSQIPADVNSIAASNPPTYSDCVKEDSSDNLPRYSDLRIV